MTAEMAAQCRTCNPDAGNATPPTVAVSLLTMKLSGGREEYFTRITCDGRTFDVRRYGQKFRNRADYEVAELRHVLLGEPKPDLAAPEYADVEE